MLMMAFFVWKPMAGCLRKKIIVYLTFFEYIMSVPTNFWSFILLDINQKSKVIDFTSGTKSIQTFYRFTFLS